MRLRPCARYPVRRWILESVRGVSLSTRSFSQNQIAELPRAVGLLLCSCPRSVATGLAVSADGDLNNRRIRLGLTASEGCDDASPNLYGGDCC